MQRVPGEKGVVVAVNDLRCVQEHNGKAKGADQDVDNAGNEPPRHGGVLLHQQNACDKGQDGRTDLKRGFNPLVLLRHAAMKPSLALHLVGQAPYEMFIFRIPAVGPHPIQSQTDIDQVFSRAVSGMGLLVVVMVVVVVVVIYHVVRACALFGATVAPASTNTTDLTFVGSAIVVFIAAAAMASFLMHQLAWMGGKSGGVVVAMGRRNTLIAGDAHHRHGIMPLMMMEVSGKHVDFGRSIYIGAPCLLHGENLHLKLYRRWPNNSE